MNKGLSLKQKAYEFIKNKIITCELMPGSDIAEDELALELGSSRTPVREAILRLEQEKLVNIYPRKGSFVAQITLKDIQEIFQIREIVETQVAKIVCESISQERLLYFKEQFEKMDAQGKNILDKEFFELDLQFHKFIVTSSNNQYLIEFINKIYDKDYRIRVLTTSMFEEERKRNKKEHLDIINAFLQKDEEKVESYLREHIKNSRSGALKIL
ncbi:GntR family transcriptional regulator [Crassaminicella profunda]|uniref:GntR family transcriptional regulator n=1 Tax=Crassaminicella profunda TaxID=1286698 RepID=UPI001CA69A1D|nr:GntR family transcriptional regulator [Crassaminicella profunda]QZY54358.1 GntR family transcriptional regulator [Crassaminicella profunda]